MHGQEHLVLLLLLSHQAAEVKYALVFDVTSAQAIQLQGEVPVAEQLGHVHGHRHGLLVAPPVAGQARPPRLLQRDGGQLAAVGEHQCAAVLGNHTHALWPFPS